MANNQENTSEKKKSEKKSEKKADKKQPNKIAKWFKDLRIEFKKVVWPSKKTVINNTSVVLAVVAGAAILVGLLDTGFLALMRLIYQ
ncbi:MAG: preprotein translocase subunit SecE [Ruminococcus sp.]|nr:preprotein translocase subunit SecE [Ruminococcus sp.]